MYIKEILDYKHCSGSTTIIDNSGGGGSDENSPEPQSPDSESISSMAPIFVVMSQNVAPGNTFHVTSILSAGLISQPSSENI